MSSSDLDVLDANTAFYAAFAARDLDAMEALWARQAPVACVHPGWDALRGREEVMASWRAIFSGNAPRIACTAASAHVAGGAAWVVCHETIPGGPRLVATNVFVREGDAWRLCHHQAGPLNQEAGEAPPGAEA